MSRKFPAEGTYSNESVSALYTCLVELCRNVNCNVAFQMEQHSKALKILVYKLEDFSEAERFCELHSKVIPNM